jgi:hypothetical protein
MTTAWSESTKQAMKRSRRCAICGQHTGAISAHSLALKALGYDYRLNAYAHIRCIAKKRGRK